MATLELEVPPAGRREWRLATRAARRTLAWPRYDLPGDLERLFGRFAALHVGRDCCLCLRHDLTVDGPIENAIRAIEAAYLRFLGPETPIELLMVDDAFDDQGWAALGRELTCVLALPSSNDPCRRERLEALGLPIIDDLGELRARIDDLAKSDRSEIGPELPPLRVRPELPNLVLIRGKGRQGKSSLAAAFRGPFQSTWVWRPEEARRAARLITMSTDGVYVDFVQRYCSATVPADWTPTYRPSIDTHWREALTTAEREAWYERLLEEVETMLGLTERWLVVEGWHLLEAGEALQAAVAGRANIIPVDVGRFVVRVGAEVEERVHVARLSGETDQAHSQRVVAENGRAVRAIVDLVRRKCAAELTSRTQYQCYDDLGQRRQNSDSAAKLVALRLPDLISKRCLDVGCNAGYFSFRLRERGAERVLGVDTAREEIRLARLYREAVYEAGGVEFEVTDVFELDGAARFDLILCASVFHYFREKQPEFLAHCRKLLAPGGLLVLECGLSELHPDRSFVELQARGVDRGDPCHFPNERALIEMATGFQIETRGPSPSQPGDRIPRVVLHLRRL